MPIADVGKVYAEGAVGFGRKDGLAAEGVGGAGRERGGVVVKHVEACAAVQERKLGHGEEEEEGINEHYLSEE